MEDLEAKRIRLELEIKELEWKKQFLVEFIETLNNVTNKLQEDINAEKKKSFFSRLF